MQLTNNDKYLLILTSISGFLVVFIGAFASHILADNISAKEALWLDKASFYHAIHTIAILAIFAIYKIYNYSKILISLWLFIAGIALFSGSLYALAFGASLGVAMLTPIGGILLLSSWLWLIIVFYKNL